MSSPRISHRHPFIIATIALAAVVPHVANSSTTFGAPYLAFDTGGNPAAVTAGDLDGDGHMDIAVANASSNTITVLRGAGDGRFVSRHDFSVGAGPRAIARADLNGDGRPDLVTMNFGDRTASILIADEQGSYLRSDGVVGSGATSLELADVNGDGRVDLVTTGLMRPGNGSGGFFGAAQPIPTASVAALADLNGDGRVDIVNAGSNFITVLLGTADGGFDALADLGVAGIPSALAIGDLNHDGTPDVAVAEDGNIENASVFLGRGDGTFAPRIHVAGPGCAAVAIADLDGDGDGDIVLASANKGLVYVLLGNGSGSFTATTFPTASGTPTSLALADLDGDGAPEVITTNDGDVADVVSVLIGNGDGTFGRRTEFAAGSRPQSVKIANLDGDPAPDLALANGGFAPHYSGSVSVLPGDGYGGFTPGANQPWTAANAVAVADLDHDGVLDLAVAAGSPGRLTSLSGDGHGNFSSGPGAAMNGVPDALAVGDLDGDGNLDGVVTVTAPDSLLVLRGRGDGSFAPPVSYTAAAGICAVALADLDGDGKVDVVVADSSAGLVSVRLGRGDGTLGGESDYAAGSAPRAVAIGDLNGDGVLDLVVANARSNSVSVLRGRGDGAFEPHVDFAAGPGPGSIALGDFDRDGKLDVALTNFGDAADLWNTVSVLPGNGDGTLRIRTAYGVGSGPIDIAAADLNGDGRLDLVAANNGPTSNSVSILLGRDHVTAIAVSEVSAVTEGDAVRLEWFASVSPFHGVVSRREAGESWRTIGDAVTNGIGLVRFIDRSVVAGHRYGYRVGFDDGVRARFSSETWIEVATAARFALEGFRPNPTTGAPIVALNLPSAAPALLELLDIAGRRVTERELTGLGPGELHVRLDSGEPIPPGLYLLRLSQEGRRLVSRACVIR